MAHTFDIRFARSGGLAAFFEAPTNTFRWRGAGYLSIDAQGLSIAVKRSLVSLLARRRSQRIPAGSIREVFREGDALRVEYHTRENRRATLPFWARDRKTAAQIVQLLPTSRTFEVEDSPEEKPPENLSRRVALMLAASVVLIVALGTLFINIRRPPAVDDAGAPAVVLPPSAADIAVQEVAQPPVIPASREPGAASTPEQAPRGAPISGTPEGAIEWQPPAAAADTPAEGAGLAPPLAAGNEVEVLIPSASGIGTHTPMKVIPLVKGTMAFDQARAVVRLFEARALELEKGLHEFRGRFETGDLRKELFIARLDADRVRWRVMGRQLVANVELQKPELRDFTTWLVAAANYQELFLEGYARGLRTNDPAIVSRAYEQQALSDEFLSSAFAYVY